MTAEELLRYIRDELRADMLGHNAAYLRGRIDQYFEDHAEPAEIDERETTYLRRIFEVATRHADRVYEAGDQDPDGPTPVADTDPEPADAELEEPSEDAPDPESAPAEDQGASEPEVEPEAEIRDAAARMPEAVLAAADIDPNDEPGEVEVESTGTPRFAPPQRVDRRYGDARQVVLDALTRHDDPVKSQVIAEETGLPHGTVYHWLKVLWTDGVVARSADGRGFVYELADA